MFDVHVVWWGEEARALGNVGAVETAAERLCPPGLCDEDVLRLWHLSPGDVAGMAVALSINRI